MGEGEEALQSFFSEVKEKDPLGEPALSSFLYFLHRPENSRVRAVPCQNPCCGDTEATWCHSEGEMVWLRILEPLVLKFPSWERYVTLCLSFPILKMGLSQDVARVGRCINCM